MYNLNFTKMKKSLFIAVAAAMVFGSCSKNEVDQASFQTPENAINFGTYVGQATKAAVESAFVADDVFAIDAYYTAQEDLTQTVLDAAPAFMQNQIVTKGESTWSYSPIKYYPNNNGDKISFFAVSNGTNKSPIGDFDDDKTPSFTVAEANTDIMVASKFDVEKPKTNAPINFTFKHVMSQVKFTVKLSAALIDDLVEDDGTTVKVTSLSVPCGNAGGTFTYDLDTESAGSWEANGTDATTPYLFAATGGVSAEGIGVELSNEDPATTLGVPLMMVPVAGAKYTATLVYTVATTDASYTDNDSTIENIFTFDIKPVAMNTIYTYNLSIGLTDVQVSGTAELWGLAESENVTVN